MPCFNLFAFLILILKPLVYKNTIINQEIFFFPPVFRPNTWIMSNLLKTFNKILIKTLKVLKKILDSYQNYSSSQLHNSQLKDKRLFIFNVIIGF